MELFEPLVSVLVPIYGVEKYIERCVRSIFEQTYQNLEIIFVNDCTPDNSIDILTKVLEDYPKRKPQTQIITHETNKGIACVRNTALSASSGYYILFIDSDDYVDLSIIQRLVMLARTEDADVTICDFFYAYKNYNRHCFVNPSNSSIECMCQVLKGVMHGGLWNKLTKRSLYVNNDISFIDGLNMMEDVSVMYRLLYFAQKISYLQMPLYYYVQNNGNSYTTVLSEKSRKNILDLISKMQEFFVKNKITDLSILSAFDVFKLLTKVMLIVYADSSIERSRYLHLFSEINFRVYKQSMLFSNYIIIEASSYGIAITNIIVWMKRRLKSFRSFINNHRIS